MTAVLLEFDEPDADYLSWIWMLCCALCYLLIYTDEVLKQLAEMKMSLEQQLRGVQMSVDQQLHRLESRVEEIDIDLHGITLKEHNKGVGTENCCVFS